MAATANVYHIRTVNDVQNLPLRKNTKNLVKDIALVDFEKCRQQGIDAPEKEQKEFVLISIGTGQDYSYLKKEDYIGSVIAYVWHYFLVDKRD